MKDLNAIMIIGYILISVIALTYALNHSGTYKMVSHCCKTSYSTVDRANESKPWCSSCKKWCEIIEIRETQ